MRAWTMAFLALFLVWGCQNSGMTSQEERNAAKGQERTNMANKSAAIKPSVDLAAPARTETATFALG